MDQTFKHYSLDQLKHKVNDECIKHGLATAFDLPPHPLPAENYFTLPHIIHMDSSGTSVTHCQLTISLANSRYIT
ncbi:hypothetical protein K443DRAFT_10487 [Laccaria amethystina LaAM-08-1]|uniref:Uncharacterized protein n=1 Tax=Laccaria amethystina LaAM-08-1 TaxID=1095629 RepID=A0A0C9X5Q7_9AGAR|nr:hypothetical protein K443DRAFT_10487 [Laccaria amethystina LaAM-08-1]